MKKFLFTSLMTLLGTQALQAKTTEYFDRPVGESTIVETRIVKDRSMSFTLDVLQLAKLTLAGEYALRLSENVALLVPVQIGGQLHQTRVNNLDNTNYSLALGTGLGARFYLTGAAMGSGFYLQPIATVAWNRALSTEVDSLKVNADLLAGYSWVWHTGFTMNIAAGLDYQFATLLEKGSDKLVQVGDMEHTLHPTMSLAFGYTW
ncbi:MAG: hypothetical protein V4534_05045 [Myxococcota bacterium]